MAGRSSRKIEPMHLYNPKCLEILLNFDEEVMSISATSDFIEDCLNGGSRSRSRVVDDSVDESQM